MVQGPWRVTDQCRFERFPLKLNNKSSNLIDLLFNLLFNLFENLVRNSALNDFQRSIKAKFVLIFPSGNSKVFSSSKHSSSNDNGNRHENVIFNIEICFIGITSRLFVLCVKYVTVSQNETDMNRVKIWSENEMFIVMYWRSTQTADFDYHSLLFCWGRQRNVPTCKTHVQSVHSYCFPHLTDCFVAF